MIVFELFFWLENPSKTGKLGNFICWMIHLEHRAYRSRFSNMGHLRSKDRCSWVNKKCEDISWSLFRGQLRTLVLLVTCCMLYVFHIARRYIKCSTTNQDNHWMRRSFMSISSLFSLSINLKYKQKTTIYCWILRLIIVPLICQIA